MAMASLFTHAVVGTALGQASPEQWRRDWRFWGLAVACSGGWYQKPPNIAAQ